MNFVLFHKPDLGRKAKKLLAQIQLFCYTNKFSIQLISNESDLLELSNKLIFVIGGDGTIHRVINMQNVFQNTYVFLGGGSGNDFVKNFDSGQLHKLFQNILADKSTEIQLWKCNELHFINAGSVGFTSFVAHLANTKFAHWKSLKYIFPILNNLFSYEGVKLKIRSETFQEEASLFFAAFGNGKFVGGGFKMFPKANPVDGFLELIVCKPPIWYSRILYMILLKWGKHLKLSVVNSIFTENVQIKTEKTVIFELDGECYSNNVWNIGKAGKIKTYWV